MKKGRSIKKKLLHSSIVVIPLCFLLLIAVLVTAVVSAESGGGRGNFDMENLPEMLTAEMISGAIESEAKYGVPASLTLAQIILESSGSYPGGLSLLAYECHNLFGMKGIGPAGYKEYETGEQTPDGGHYVVTAKFRRYHNVGESIDDHGKLLAGPPYSTYTKNCKTYQDWARAIYRAGYATAVDYADRLIEIIETYGLFQFDKGGMMIGNGVMKGKFVWPTVSNSVITSHFGYRDQPTGGASTYHEGIDIGVPGDAEGSPIYATNGGKVTFAGYNGGYGNCIIISHGNGITSQYSHLKQGDGISVRKGQTVSRGQRIGKMGNTGTSSGTHLDFRIFVNGKAVDPEKYVKKP